jgi:hypothetical protein
VFSPPFSSLLFSSLLACECECEWYCYCNCYTYCYCDCCTCMKRYSSSIWFSPSSSLPIRLYHFPYSGKHNPVLSLCQDNLRSPLLPLYLTTSFVRGRRRLSYPFVLSVCVSVSVSVCGNTSRLAWRGVAWRLAFAGVHFTV